MKTALFGGTFDPVHLGHLQVAHNALQVCSLGRICFVPCAAPPHKVDEGLVDGKHRLAMLNAAIPDEPRFQVLDLEIQRGGTSYSADTLRELRRRYPADEFFFAMGSDNFEHVGEWHRFAEVLRLCEFLVVERPGFPLRLPPPSVRPDQLDGLRYHVVPGPAIDVSSTQIRRRLAAGQSVSHLLPLPVESYIRKHHLYQGIS